jgi:hypothetical protein
MFEERKLMLHGQTEDSPECEFCGCLLDLEKFKNGPLICPRCERELSGQRYKNLFEGDWFNWVSLDKQDYDAVKCFNEPNQKSLHLAISCSDPRGSDIALEVTRDNNDQILVKVKNNTGFTYFPYQSTEIKENYTVVTFRQKS